MSLKLTSVAQMSLTCDVKIHPLSKLFPAMEASEAATFEADIKERGVRQPILLWREQVVDGRHRFETARKVKLSTVPVQRYPDEATEEEVLMDVVGLNLHRRHLTSGQRAVVAAKARAMLSAKKDKNRKADRSDDEAAAQYGTNRQYVRDAEKLETETPDLADEVLEGKKSLPEATREAQKRKATNQAKAAAPKKKDDVPTDAKGTEIPEAIREHFEMRKEYLALMKDVTSLKAKIEKMAEDRIGTAFLDLQACQAHLNTVHGDIKYAQPYVVCPECAGKNTRCKVCRGSGYLNQSMYKAWGNNSAVKSDGGE